MTNKVPLGALRVLQLEKINLKEGHRRVITAGLEQMDDNQFLDVPGKEHYRFLAALGNLYQDRDIIDIGTHYGRSALALAQNTRNQVHTFDIAPLLSEEQKYQLYNGLQVKFYLENLWDTTVREQWRYRLLNAAIIFLDIDPHEGSMEYELYTWLRDNKFQGLLVCDDIWYFKGMRDRFWYHVPAENKMDVTALGHWSGTGLIFFNQEACPLLSRFGAIRPPARDSHIIRSPGEAPPSWTVVTAYFDLTRRADASQEIKDRPQSYYLEHANMTMAMQQNLIVFCDIASLSALQALRPVHLQERTRYIVREFEDFSLVRECDAQLTANRVVRPSQDPRNTVSYYLFCMLRYEMILEVMAANPFSSSHFAWCNICIERMSWKGGPAFDKVWAEFRPKFSTCYIDYQSRARASDIMAYYCPALCGMCSGFFTGNHYYFGTFCQLVLAKFRQCLMLGVGHADEQLYTLVYFENPELFDFYLGDYGSMIVNYGWVVDDAHPPVYNVLRRLSESSEDPVLLRKLCCRWLDSVDLGACFPPADQIATVKGYLMNA
jgi:predicted O-methyltransferase YrrM